MHRLSVQMRKKRIRGKCGLSTTGEETSCFTPGSAKALTLRILLYPSKRCEVSTYFFCVRLCEELQGKHEFQGLLSSLINFLGVQLISFYKHLSLPIPKICIALNPFWKP